MKSWTQACILLARLRGDLTVQQSARAMAWTHGQRAFSWRAAAFVTIRSPS